MKETEQVIKIVKNNKQKKPSIKKNLNNKKGQKEKTVNTEISNDSKDKDDEDDNKPEAEAKVEKEMVIEKRRDFTSDLMSYISLWSDRENSGHWKFNKILQTWALDNCFDKQKISVIVFKALMPYLLSIKGSAVDRLLLRAEEIITKR